MRIFPAAFTNNERVFEFLKRLAAKKHDLKGKELIDYWTSQLIVATNGTTYLLEDLLQPTDKDTENRNLKFLTHRGEEVSLEWAKNHPKHLIHNRPLAEVLQTIYATPKDQYPLHFSMPRTSCGISLDTFPFVEPLINLDEESVEEIQTKIYPQQKRSVPNYSLYELLWLRFDHPDATLYDSKKLTAEVAEQRLAIENIQKLHKEKLTSIDTELADIEKKLNRYPAFKNKNLQQLNETHDYLDKKKKQYWGWAKILPNLASAAIFAIGALTLAPFIMIAITPGVNTVAAIVGLCVSFLCVGAVSSIFSYVANLSARDQIRSYFHGKIADAGAQQAGIKLVKSLNDKKKILLKDKPAISVSGAAYEDRLSALDKLKEKMNALFSKREKTEIKVSACKATLHQATNTNDVPHETEAEFTAVAKP